MPHRLVRPLVGYATVACAMPYLALKANWLAGGQLGVANVEMMREASMVALNLVTAGVGRDGAARQIRARRAADTDRASAGRRWNGRIVSIVSSRHHRGRHGTGAFVGIRAGLRRVRWPRPRTLAAFVLYARVRWHAVLQLQPVHASQAGSDPTAANATRAVQAPLIVAAALMAATVGALHIAWACGATTGLTNDLIAHRTFNSHVINGVDGVVMMGAAIGSVMLVLQPRNRRNRRNRAWLALSLTWIGSGFLFSWGLWGLVNVLAGTPLVRDRPSTMAVLNLLGLIQIIAGLVIGIVMLFVLAERQESNCEPTAVTLLPSSTTDPRSGSSA